jgi:membrane-bound ClpP family serine protease
MASDEAWQAAHQSAAIWVVVAGIVLFLGGVQVMLADSETAGGVLALITTAAMLIPIGIAYQRGQAAARSSMKR